MTYINQYEWDPEIKHNLAVSGAINEYLKRSGAYVGPDDPFAPDDFRNPKYYLPKVSDEVKQELLDAMRIIRMAYVYELRFYKLRSGEDDAEDFLRLLKAQLVEIGYPRCDSCGVRDLPDPNHFCRYCGEVMN